MMSEWGRSHDAGIWPARRGACTAVVLLTSVLMGAGVFAYHFQQRWTPLQRVYLAIYIRTGVMDSLGLTRPRRFRLLEVATGLTTRLALDDEVIVAQDDPGDLVELSDVGRRLGDRGVGWREVVWAPGALHTLLRHWIYSDRDIGDLMRPALWGGVGLLVPGLLLAIPADVLRARRRRHGRRLKGPELVSVASFNRRTRAMGIGFVQRSGAVLRIPHALESSHFLIVGDSGTGKSALIRQLLRHVEARQETAIVYDPALEYTSQFYRPERGDVILNPLDVRCPFWTPSDEWRHEAETLTLATSLFPDRHHENAFFTEAPRRIFAHLLSLKPSPQQLAWWLCHDEEIDRRVARTAYAVMIDRQAPAQRSGVLASLNMVADTLKLLPPETATTGRWSASTWATEWPHGWLFFTSTPETRQRLVPLMSLWLDTLVLRLMNQGQPRQHPTWFVFDELASLQRLPQLHTALTENRKSNNPVVLGFQGRSQLEARYGHDAEAMLSQPATKMFLRTSEPRAAKWISEAIGEIEIERLRESRSHGRGDQQSFGLERQVEPLVMPSEICGLPALCGFLKVGNLVVRLEVPFIRLPARTAAFIERDGVTGDAGGGDAPMAAPGASPRALQLHRTGPEQSMRS
jgi:hypothetical protein